ncbi:hypothetical protein M422DRAFT_24402, partial [Sphaerobolus stellatus SS14]
MSLNLFSSRRNTQEASPESNTLTGSGPYTDSHDSTSTSFSLSSSFSRTRCITERTNDLLALGVVDISGQLTILGDAPFVHGVWSSIWLGELPNGTRVAVKLFVPTRSNAGDDIVQEATSWSRAMGHENVQPLLGFASFKASLSLVSPWVSEGNLKMYLRKYPGADKLGLMLDIARGLTHTHAKGIVYGNLRATTVAVTDNGRALLSSFLFANSIPEDVEMDPNDENFEKIYTLAALFNSGHTIIQRSLKSGDVFSFGSLVLEAFPLSYEEREILKNDILLRKIPQQINTLTWEDKLWLMVQQCWSFDRKDRPTMDVVVSLLEDIVTKRGGPPVKSAADPELSTRALMNISAQIKKLSEHPIASGGYCDLYLGERFGKEKVALKLVRLFGSTEADKEIARRRFLKEAGIWATLYHHRILEFYGICDYGTLPLFMVSPFLSNGNIMRYLVEVNPEANRYRLLVETAEGLAYLHSRQPPVIHGDLKGANILISNSGSALLADFGLSRLSHEATTANLQGAGSPRWLAPELVHTSDIPEGMPLKTVQSDVYAFAHVMLE